LKAKKKNASKKTGVAKTATGVEDALETLAVAAPTLEAQCLVNGSGGTPADGEEKLNDR